MNDFNGSVAQQDVSISTDVVRTATVGGNFYENVLYVTDRFSPFGGDTPDYPVVKKSNYADVLNDYAYFSDAGMQPRDPCRPWRGTLASGHKPR